MATGTKLLKKLTIRTFIGGKPEVLAYAMTGRPQRAKVDKDQKPVLEKDGKTPVMEGYGAEGQPVPLMRVLGACTGFKAGESDFGSYVEMRGAFQATNLQTGEVIDGLTKCILPSVVGEAVAGALQGGGESVEFAIEIDTRYHEAAATMYEFDCRSLLKPQAPKAIESLAAKLAQAGIEMTKPLAIANAPTLSDEDKAKQADAEKTADAARSAKNGDKKAGAKETAKA